ncbi:MAG: peptidoglycan-binding protein [Cyanomargarita calcarea GSE-NOS-MK-12-04C]|jgi:peptidoglycan hydrolase-like protein with peptidoglycan-binding domain|uniref:Peptidoglycan-binding protein n=1 Tax=Cyanomargarita calcarea GSE-NOS-MK-12-04C TaxID=2839659 RepID=A0A951QLL0_9CYAN|nr:peptidoglycan-binding protein [Cyanomargarita calcarea GSE-NOS-MK-12-04C]
MTYTEVKLNKPVLTEGSSGANVKELQILLKDSYHLYTDAIDGVFGANTRNAVKAYQHRVFLNEDGIVEDKTWLALYKGAPIGMPILKEGDKGDLVMLVQKIVIGSKDYRGKIDGKFGSDTEKAVKALQKRTGLPTDGIVEDRTWYELSKLPH